MLKMHCVSWMLETEMVLCFQKRKPNASRQSGRMLMDRIQRATVDYETDQPTI